jgi:hypothetical protein
MDEDNFTSIQTVHEWISSEAQKLRLRQVLTESGRKPINVL